MPAPARRRAVLAVLAVAALVLASAGCEAVRRMSDILSVGGQ